MSDRVRAIKHADERVKDAWADLMDAYLAAGETAGGDAPGRWARSHAPGLMDACRDAVDHLLEAQGSDRRPRARRLAAKGAYRLAGRRTFRDDENRVRGLERWALEDRSGGAFRALVRLDRGPGLSRAVIDDLIDVFHSGASYRGHKARRNRAGDVLGRVADRLDPDELTALLGHLQASKTNPDPFLEALLAHEETTIEHLKVAARELTSPYRFRKRLATDGRIFADPEGRALLGDSQGKEVLEGLLVHAEGERLRDALLTAARHYPEAAVEALRARPDAFSGLVDEDDLVGLLSSSIRDVREGAIMAIAELPDSSETTPRKESRGR